MTHFQIPHSKLFLGPTRMFVKGNSGLERLVLHKSGKPVTLELEGLAGSAVKPTIKQVNITDASGLAGATVASPSAGTNRISVSAPTGAGTKRTFTVKAENTGFAALVADGATPLLVVVGEFKNHKDVGDADPLEIDLIADVFRASDPAKMHTLTRMLFSNEDNLFDEFIDRNQRDYPSPGGLPCGSVSKGRGSMVFRPVEYDYRDYFVYFPKLEKGKARAPLERKDLKIDSKKLELGCKAIKKRLAKGMAPVMGLVYNLDHAVLATGDINVTGSGGHSVPIVGCSEDATKFLYIDVYRNGSQLKYSGGFSPNDLFAAVCKYLGIFELTDDPDRGFKILRMRRGTAVPGGTFSHPEQFLEVVSGPLTG